MRGIVAGMVVVALGACAPAPEDAAEAPAAEEQVLPDAGTPAAPAPEVESAPAPEADGRRAPGADAAPAPAPGNGAAPQPDPSPAPPSRPDEPDRAVSIPARFHGEWNADPAACGRATETRLRISADRIRFYESTGVVRAVDVESDRAITVTAEYTGEGDTWEDRRRLSLSADGSELTVSNGTSLVRHRCP